MFEKIILIFSLLLFPTLLIANKEWFVTIIIIALLNPISFIINLIIESLLIKKLFHLTPKQSIKSTFIAIIISYPFAIYLATEFMYQELFMKTAIMIIIFKWLIYKTLFKYYFPLLSKKFLYLFLLNLLSMLFIPKIIFS